MKNEILKHIQNKLGKGNYLIQKTEDIFFITRFKSSNLILLLINEKWYALTDQRYYESAVKELKNFKVIDMMDKDWLLNLKKENNFSILNIDSTYHSVHEAEKLKENFNLKNISVELKNYGYIRDIYLKDDLNKIRKSAELNDEIFKKVREEIKVGMSEKDVYKLIMTKTINSKADKESFEPIVASGVNGANPHHHASDKIITENEMVTIDMGVFYEGFASDMTRTFVVSGKVSEEEIKIWNSVNKAMEECIKMIKPGVSTKDLHINAERIINNAGFEGYFNHGLGHGLGVEIHDQPNLNPYSKDVLMEGQTITIEPGIYIPGKFGVRLEKDVIITKNGYEEIQKSPVDLY